MSSIIDALVALEPSLEDGMQPTSEYVLIRCPYHSEGQERTPSMSVSLIKPVFFCHGCKESGHVSKLLRHYGLSSKMASDTVSQAGFGDSQREADAPPVSNDAPLASKHGGAGKAYILDEDVLDEYRLAPKRLLDAGFDARTLQSFEVGVDELNSRITFPLRDFHGNLVGVSGRSYAGQEPKYKIYKSELTSRKGFGIPRDYSLDSIKGQLLWNGYRVIPEIKDGDQLVITEGFKAAMWVHQCGHRNVVALIGSYLTREHAERISKMSRDPKVLVFLDGDDAGKIGTHKAINRLIRKGVGVRVVKYLDERNQPDDLSPDEVTNALENSQTYIEWQMDGANKI